MNSNKLIFKNSIILYVRLIVTSIVGLLVLRFVLQNLGVSDFGLYSVVGGIVSLMVFLNTVMISTTYRFIAFEMGRGNDIGINKVFNISLVTHMSIVFLIILMAESIGRWYVFNKLNVEVGRVDDAFFVFRMSILATIFNIFSIPYQGLLTAKEKFSVIAFVEITKSILILALVSMLFIYNGDKLRLYAILMAFVTFIYSLLFIIYCRRNYHEQVRWLFQKDKNKYIEMLKYSGWIMFGAASSVGQVQGSALLINSFFNTALNTSFGIANQVNLFLKMFAGNLGQAVVPQITKSYSGGNHKRTEELVFYTGKYVFFLVLISGIPIFLEAEYLLQLWLGSVPEYALIFTQLMIIKAILDSLRSGITQVIHATGKIKWFQIILSSAMLLSLPIAYVFFKFGYEPYTILVIILCIGVFNTILRLIMLKIIVNFNVLKLLKVSYLKILYVSLSTFPLFYINDFIDPGFARFTCSVFLSVLYILVSIYLLGIEKREREILKYRLSLLFKSQNR